MLDPDAPGGTFTHWLVYGLRPGLSSLPAVPAGAAEGVSDFGRRGYGGPCPPRGAAHHYHVVVLALDTRLGLAAGATRSDLESRTSGHVRTGRHLPARLTRPLPRQVRKSTCSAYLNWRTPGALRPTIAARLCACATGLLTTHRDRVSWVSR